MNSGIYCTTNPSGKIYIGSACNIKRRFGQYNRLSCKNQLKIYNSLAKYGPENHKFDILEYCEVDKLLEKEQMYLDFYCNPFPENTLNIAKITGSATRGKIYSEESKMKMRKPKSEETKQKMSIAKQNMSEETKQKMSIAVLQYSKDGKFIAEYYGAREAEKQTGVNNGHICKCCKDKRKSAGGYIWKYKENK